MTNLVACALTMITSIVMATTAFAQVCPEGIVAYWKLDEGSGTTATDSAGANHGTINGAATWTTGQINGALTFDGVDDYVSIAHSEDLNFGTGDFSFMFWAKIGNLAAGRFFRIEALDNYAIYVNDGNFNEIYAFQRGPFSWTADTGWHFVAVVRSLGNLTVYVDAVSGGTKVFLDDLGDSASLKIGYLMIPYPAGYGLMIGDMDEFAVLNRGLTAAEILEYYQNGLNGLGYEGCITTVDIDIKPGSFPNAVNLGSNGVVPVAILSSPTFDASDIDADTVELAGAGVTVRGRGNKLMAHLEDVNGDSLLDLVLQIETQNFDPAEFQDGFAVLTGTTFGGQQFEGVDEIILVP